MEDRDNGAGRSNDLTRELVEKGFSAIHDSEIVLDLDDNTYILYKPGKSLRELHIPLEGEIPYLLNTFTNLFISTSEPNEKAESETYANKMNQIFDIHWMKEHLHEGVPIEVDYHRTIHGKSIWFRITLSGIRDSDGTAVNKVVVFTTDITSTMVDRAQLQYELNSVKEQLDQAISKSDAADKALRKEMAMLRSFRNIYEQSLYINVQSGEYEMISIPKEYEVWFRDHKKVHHIIRDASTSLTQSLVNSDYQDGLNDFLNWSTLNERFQKAKVLSYECRSTQDSWYRCNLIPVDRDAKGNILHVIFAIQNIDNEKKKEHQYQVALLSAMHAADDANKAKSDFLSRMSHDIRTPMNAIIGLTAIAQSHLDDRYRIADCLSKITESSNHLLALINEVLDMSRIESGNISLSEENFDLSALIDNLITMTKEDIEAKHQTLSVDIHDVDHELVIGDSLRIQQVFTNLMNNACKYTPEGGKIHVSISEKPSSNPNFACYEFVITDNGIGMSADFLPHIFEPFSRENGISGTGTGLGMAITKNIVTMMHGDIMVTSTPGKGSTFIVTIFLGIRNEVNESYQKFADLSVLLVDNDEVTCESVSAILSNLGMRCEWRLSGKKAIETICSHHRDGDDYFAALIDWKMPEMDGIETTRVIRRNVGDKFPIVIISAYDWTTIEQQARKAGVNAFISKPLFKSKLVRLFDRLLGKPESGEEKETLSELTQKENFDGYRVLLAEDNDINAEIAIEVLKMTGLDVDRAFNGKEAVDMMAASKPGFYAAIFMDIRMPIMDGNEATRAIRTLPNEDARTIPIFAMTANAFVEDVRMAIGAGMNEHIAKPLDFKKLMATLNKWIGNKKVLTGATKHEDGISGEWTYEGADTETDTNAVTFQVANTHAPASESATVDVDTATLH